MGKDKNSNSRTKLLLTGVMAAAVILLIVLLFGFFDLGHRIALLTYTKISTYEDLKAISNKPDGKYYLACDIDMAGIEWTPVTFNGTLDGNGHAIKNLRLSTKGNAVRDTYDGNMKSYQTTLVGLFDVIEKASVEAGLPKGWIVLMETRSDVSEMLLLDQYIDLIIPRGSNSFVQYIMQHSSIPVMGHADGVCHLYIHEKADPDMALKIAVDSKTQYVAVCNACETILVDESIAGSFLPALAKALSEKNVELHGCEKTKAILPEVLPVEEWHHEYLDYKVSIKVVSGLKEAVAHINKYGSGHTDSIVTSDAAVAEEFMNSVSSGNAFWNCSTRFSDGFRYGFGAEVGISTSKLHARGPVGLEGLVTYKYKIRGNGNIVADYASGARKFTHKHIK